MALRKTSNTSSLPFTSLDLTTDLTKTGTHVSGDYGSYIDTTNDNIYLTSPSGNGNEDYATTIISGMSVTGTGVPSNTAVDGTPSFVPALGIWTIPVSQTVTYSSVEGSSITFTKDNHTSQYNQSSATVTSYSNVDDEAGGSADYIVYKWSRSRG
jgi:hypothetical protein